VVDKQFAGLEGSRHCPVELTKRGMQLLLDFVPNHVAPAHPWVTEHLEYSIRGNADDARTDPAADIVVVGTVYTCGWDQYFPA
jgi:glycosidase